jgi:hypothetical protein
LLLIKKIQKTFYYEKNKKQTQKNPFSFLIKSEKPTSKNKKEAKN